MTTNEMTHDAFTDGLMAFLENDLDSAARSAMERHAQGCAECGAMLADIRAIRADAARLPQLTPSRDLWAGIAARIEAPVVSIASATPAAAFPAATRPVSQRPWVLRLAFAASLVGAVSLGYFGATRARAVDVPDVSVASLDTTLRNDSLMVAAPDSADSTADARAGATPPAPGMIAARLAVAKLAEDYDREIARLRTLVDQRRNQMDPVTVAVIEKNLTVIDAAIADSKKAIARDPASRFLIESLNASLESKVELLRIAAALPNRS